MLKKIVFQLHWFFGISAGLILAIMGVTGALYSYDKQILRTFNHDSYVVSAQNQPLLTPAEVYEKLNRTFPDKKINTITVNSSNTEAATVNFAIPNNRRGENIQINPYTAEVLPKVQGEKFFQMVQDIHRRMATGDFAKKEIYDGKTTSEFGKQLTGACTLILIFFVLSGLYMRWPKKSSLREWFAVKWTLSGRSFLWSLHAIVGTWVLLFYLLLSLTGLYWSYDWYRDALFKVMQVERPQPQGGAEATPRPHMQATAGADTSQQAAQGANPVAGKLTPEKMTAKDGSDDKKIDAVSALTQGWQAFNQQVKAYSSASFKVPAKTTLEVTFLDALPQHERARNTFKYDLKAQEVKEISYYRDKKLNEKIMSSMLPVHRGNFFGPVWQFLTMLAALSMPLFFISGWLLYLKRRKQKKLTKAEQLALSPVSDQQAWLLVYASQTGYAEQLAWRTAHSLHQAGIAARVLGLDKLSEGDLSSSEKVIFVLSTYGQGEPPDNARLFAKRQLSKPLQLTHLNYAVLALGDREYKDTFCGFGHQVNTWLKQSGARPLFELIEVNNGNTEDLQRWNQRLADITHTRLESVIAEKIFDPWTLSQRELLNPNSLGEAAYSIQLVADYETDWNAGDIAEIQCGNSDERILAFIAAQQLNAETTVQCQQQSSSLFTALRYSNLTQQAIAALSSKPDNAQDWVDALPALPNREYSIASIPQDGYLQLVVRQQRDAHGEYGLGSGWLTRFAQEQQPVRLRIRSNESFHAPDDNRPVILIGNGTGIAGLLSILKHRELHKLQRNWLIFGERQRQHDFFFHEQINHWLAERHLEQVDLAFSRDQEQRVYVQQRLAEQAELLRQWVAEGASIYVCGSIKGMAPAVDQVLNDILGENLMEQLAIEQRYRRDVY